MIGVMTMMRDPPAEIWSPQEAVGDLMPFKDGGV
jgi:hypothetical protein